MKGKTTFFKNKLFVSAFLVMLIVSFSTVVLAVGGKRGDDAVDAVVDFIDQAMGDFPLLGKIFGNERMSVYIEEQAPFNVVTKNGKVESPNPEGTANQTIKVYDAGTIDQLVDEELTPPGASCSR